VLAEDPDLAAAVASAEQSRAKVAAIAPLLTVERGPWEPPAGAHPGDLGLLVLSGLLSRELEVAGRTFVELRGPEDILRPWDDTAEVTSVRGEISWTAREATRLAWLDRDFAAAVAPWPEIAGALMGRALRRARLLSFRLAIVELRHVDLRVLLLLWHLADRWGRVRPEGVRLDLRLTHELLAHMVGAHRTSVTLAVRKLREEGRLARGEDGGWLLLGEPPLEVNDTVRALSTGGA
jgi:CRP-like cAMP-binding protein